MNSADSQPPPATQRKTYVLSAVLTALSWLPLPALHALGRLTGRLFWYLPTRERDITRTNLALCFPEQSDRERERLGLNSLEHTGRALWEIAAMWRWPQARLQKLIVREVNREIFDEALALNRGVILASPHIGAWELITTHIGCRHPMINMYRPSRSRAMDPIVCQARSRFGSQNAPATPRGVRMVLKALHEKKVVGILPDQEPDREGGVFAPFFGQPACTMTLLCKLAARARAPVVFCVMKRLKSGYEMHYLKSPPTLCDSDPQTAATALNAMVEACVRCGPEQYLWSYKRFSLLPEGGKRRYRPRRR
ncbi:lysophospholipid acyltransferase family protein [Granulosicoccaceae sp. 1_MG-2023]|nr:lysophospholipid acyltransferase family protein [Granulosicoccaceae sp. 1_MG-2023]